MVQYVRMVGFVFVVFALVSTAGTVAQHLILSRPLVTADAELPAIVINDNRRPAGAFENGTLILKLRAAAGAWKPEGKSGPALRAEAFGEGVSPLSAPAPLIRVPEGAEIIASVRNELATPLRVSGLCERGAGACAPIDVAPSETREVRFKAGRAGTYHYWGTSMGAPLQLRAINDNQLSGAFIVDRNDEPIAEDRIFVITDWTDLNEAQYRQLVGALDPGVVFRAADPRFTFVINGESWPHTERLTYRVGERVHWRVINLSPLSHTMHLHGFYFDVDSTGDGVRDQRYADGSKPRVVTQLMTAGATMAMTWVPEREGNWLFHCHIRDHVAPERRLTSTPGAHTGHHDAKDPGVGMAGMVMGVTVLPAEDDADNPPPMAARTARQMTLELREEPNRFGASSAFGFVLASDSSSQSEIGLSTIAPVPVPGPTLVLRRGEPVAITLVNELPEATAIHWHGMELESYFDGVHGYSGAGQRVTPMIAAGGSFVVRFTPPRTGTFLYHTHLHDNRQLTSGLYGAMLVIEPDATFDETTDHVFVLGKTGPDALTAPATINGERELQAGWKAGTPHRVRLINITPSEIYAVTLITNDGLVTWTPLTKDGAPVPADRRDPRLARVVLGAGETYDFEVQAPKGRQNLWMEVRTAGGKWQTQGQIIVR